MITNTKRSPKRSIRRFMKTKRYSLMDNIMSLGIGLALSAFIIPGMVTSQASTVNENQTAIVSDTVAESQSVAETDNSNSIIQISTTDNIEETTGIVDTAVTVVTEEETEPPIGPAYDPKLLNANEARSMDIEEIGPGIAQVEEVVEEIPVVEPEEEFAYFEQVPYDAATQKAIDQICDNYDVPVEIVYGIMNRESNFNPSAFNGRDYGACQIRDCNHKWINKQVGRQLDYLNVLDSAEAACIVYNNEKASTVGSDNPNMILMSYNMGPQTAKRLWKEGKYSSKYSRAVLSYANSLGWVQD